MQELAFIVYFSVLIFTNGFSLVPSPMPFKGHLPRHGYDMGLPFESGTLANQLGVTYKDEIKNILRSCGYGPALSVADTFQWTEEGTFNVDIICTGSRDSWDKLVLQLDPNFIANAPPPDIMHTLVGECKLSSATLTDWVLDTKCRGISKHFLQQK